MITYRTPTDFDIPTLVSLERQLFEIDPWTRAQWKEEFAELGKSRHYIVAESDGQIVGYAGIYFVAADVPSDIFNIAVVPEYRGQGIAKYMLNEIEQWARSKGVKTSMLEVDVNNPNAIALYKGAGYKELNIRKDYYAPGVDGLVMEKAL